jgi:hypothetical protein
VQSTAADGLVITTGEFSLISVLNNNPMLRKTFDSKDKNDRQLTARLMKAAVCLNLSTGAHGAYTVAKHNGE